MSRWSRPRAGGGAQSPPPESPLTSGPYAGQRSPLRPSGYGGGRTGSGRMGPGGDFLGPENNGRSPNGIPMPGVAMKQVVPLAGQPPVGTHGDWGAAPSSWGSQGVGL